MSELIIPKNVNELDRHDAAKFYHESLGSAIHPLYGPNQGREKERGKRPIRKGWKEHKASDVTPEDLLKYFGNGQQYNVGCVVRDPFVFVDLDSKADQGASVASWLAKRPELAQVPRERTGGGAHLIFICRDLPESVQKAKKAPVAAINDNVTAELYHDGLNIVLSPSVHSSGHVYRWDVTGPIPEVSWSQLQSWFGFSEPRRRGRPGKGKPWWSIHKGNLYTLDIVSMMWEVSVVGNEINADEAKWEVLCPWRNEHSDGGKNDRPSSDTVVFEAIDKFPGFKCLHSHCDGRSLEHLCAWAEEQSPGIVDRHCKKERVWNSKPRESNRESPRILLPGLDRLASEYCDELGGHIKHKNDLFVYFDNVVRIGLNNEESDLIKGLVVKQVRSGELVTRVERHVETGFLSKDDCGDLVFMANSMSEAMARITIASSQFLDHLPKISRILDIPVPLIHEGELVYPDKGYDPRFRTYLDPNAPDIVEMSLDEATRWLLGEVLATQQDGGFCFEDDSSRAHALARLITPFCRGLMNWKRSPLWIFLGNREGCGKDTLAQVTMVLYTGRPKICAPLSKNSDDEMRKRITSALLAGSRYFHLGNMKGYIRFPSLEAATDNTGVWEDRTLGVSKNVDLPNEMEFSLSANGASWEPDIERRSRIISLHYSPEDINNRTFRHPDLDHFIREHRSELLSAVAALVRHWFEKGRPAGPTPFASFPEWGRVVGGVMHACKFPDPCLPQKANSLISGDQNTDNMREFFSIAHEKFGEQFVKKADLYELVDDSDGNLFSWIDLEEKGGQTALGRLIKKFNRRELDGVTLEICAQSKNNIKYRFLKSGDAENTLPQSEESAFAAFDEMNRSGTSGTSGGFSQPSAPDKVYSAKKPGQNQGHRELRGLPQPKHSEIKYISSAKEEANLIKGDIEPVTDVPEVPDVPGSTIESKERFIEIAKAIHQADTVALDLETYGDGRGDGLNPWKGDIRLLTLKIPGKPAWLIDLMGTGYDLGPLHRVLEKVEVIGHNLKFDALWLRQKCGVQIGRAFCTMTAERIMVAGLKKRCGLADVIRRHLKRELPKEQQRSDWGGMFLTDDQMHYAAADVEHLDELKEKQIQHLDANHLRRVFDLEMDLLPVVVEMEYNGMAVDTAGLKAIRDEADNKADAFCEQLRCETDRKDLNPSSPQQLVTALEMAGIEVASTSEEALKASGDTRLAPLILGFREAQKISQQAELLLKSVAPDGRIHGRFEPTGTETGRFSSKTPNLQNIARGALRQCFVAGPGKKLVVADYSQAELRAAATLANEREMLGAYRTGKDLHRKTASIVLRKPEDEVTKEDRQLAKAVNFGLLYGQGAEGLVRYAASSYGVTLSERQAKSIRDRFFHAYPALKKWHDKAHKKAKAKPGEVRTILGRRRLLPRENSYWNHFTALVNTPVQGGCADVMKLALLKVDNILAPEQRLISTIHDEMVVEVPKADAEAVAGEVERLMIEAMSEVFPKVVAEVEAEISDYWEKG